MHAGPGAYFEGVTPFTRGEPLDAHTDKYLMAVSDKLSEGPEQKEFPIMWLRS